MPGDVLLAVLALQLNSFFHLLGNSTRSPLLTRRLEGPVLRVQVHLHVSPDLTKTAVDPGLESEGVLILESAGVLVEALLHLGSYMLVILGGLGADGHTRADDLEVCGDEALGHET